MTLWTPTVYVSVFADAQIERAGNLNDRYLPIDEFKVRCAHAAIPELQVAKLGENQAAGGRSKMIRRGMPARTSMD